MTYAARWMKAVLTAALAVVVMGFIAQAQAVDLPLAAASPLTGVAFDDRPLLLPVQRNFQMAMLTAGSELGRSCGKMEAYGWRMSQTEQGRVNQIFNNTVDRLRLLGYNIAPQILTSVSNDITLFTADRTDKHFLFLWSAGELGLVLNMCETSAPLTSTAHAPMNLTPSVEVFPVAMDALPSRLPGSKASSNFSPVGDWIGGYTCAQGYTGGTLQIGPLHGKNFEGVFKFYPTIKNPSEPPGSYTVYGQYDAETKRILINPGKWIYRPKDFYNTVIVGGFDPTRDTFSAYFQGISGCTSFEATRSDDYVRSSAVVLKQKKHVVKKKKNPVKKPPATAEIVMPPPSDNQTGVGATPALNAPALAGTPAAPPAPAPSSAPVPSSAPTPDQFLTPTSPAPAPAPTAPAQGIPVSGTPSGK